MEVSDLYKSTTSLREKDDEEALKWAALEKLPTYDRLKKGILTTSRGEASEINIKNLGQQERKKLIERLVKVAEEDNEKFLLKLRNRIDRVGISLPTIEVRFEHLNVEAESYVGSRALPTFLNINVNIIGKRFSILNDVSGIIKPSRMTLLLGPPSSGKTTLLLALAGKLGPDLKFSGRVTYNGHDMNEFVPQRTAAYIGQYDIHIGEMTVRETLAFSARCLGVGSHYDMLAELSRREKEANVKPDPDIDIYMKAEATEGQEASVVTDYILKVLGLEEGISGGQRQRVTTGEMLVGPAKAFFMDEISTGLDSSTTFQIVNTLKQYIHILDGTAVISLLQPAPETYDLFDDITLLSNGQIFFESVGFKCPERKGVADFLQEVTSRKDQEQYWALKDEPYSFVTVQDFAKAFQSFHVGMGLGDEIVVPYNKRESHKAALTTKMYGVSKRELLKACMSREYLLMKRNSFVYFFKLMQLSTMAIVAMTVFLRTKMHRHSVADGVIFLGALFFSLVTNMFNGMSEILMTVAKLPVFYKQRNLLFYPSWAYALPLWILKIPITLIEVGVWVFMTYYVIGRLLKQCLLLFVLTQMASALFRFLAGVGRNMIVTNIFAFFILLLSFALSGFWIWGYWISPLMYAQNAMVANELLAKSWSHVLPNSTEPLGVEIMKSRGFFPHEYWYWIGVGALIGFILLFNLYFTLALTYLNREQIGEGMHLTCRRRNRSNSTGGATYSHLTNIGPPSVTTEATMRTSSNMKRGMILPFQPHSITFDEITYSVDVPKEMRNQGIHEDKLMLLKGVSGAFRPSVLTALMGVSGAGKTTLMDVLAGRKTGGYIEGNITISGYPKKLETFARISGYCEQNDIHSPHITVYNSLLYSSWLRLSSEANYNNRKMFIEEVMELVELNPMRQALVGLPGVNGLSTEQRKRLTIAVELVANPSIIFMDEPTSGLGARAAAIVMRTVRNTVDTGRTVVCTIHQPSIDIFKTFDELFLMKRGGQEIYVGPLGHHSCHLIKYFESIQGVQKINDGYNPATWMLELKLLLLCCKCIRNNKALIKELSKPAPGSKDLYFPTRYSQPFFTQCIMLFTIAIALTFGTMFWDLASQTEKQQDIFNAMGSMYAAIFFLDVQNASSVQRLQPVVDVERTLPYVFLQAAVYAMTTNHHIASIVSTAFYALWNLFSGFIIPKTRIPIWWRRYYWACPVAWTLYGLVVSQFGDVKDMLDNGKTVEDFARSYFGFKQDFLRVVAVVVVGFAVLFAFMFAFSIMVFKFQKR
ncbi:hypothetical protein ACJW31_05G060400 [Castanea mollissima]